MGENTKIEWCAHTFNPWRGCTKVSAGCANCYAEQLSKRNPATLGIWGDNGTRVVAAESYWKQPLKWNREAEKAGERRRVFCASLADVFEDRPELLAPRLRLFDLIRCTPCLDWLLLTKRPQNIDRLMLATARIVPGCDDSQDDLLIWLSCWPGNPPANLWLGVSVENQEQADKRIPELLKIPARVRFLSCEPLLGPVDLQQAIPCGYYCDEAHGHISHSPSGIHWVIAGGESGPNARPMHPGWARSLRDQCQDWGISFHFKQVGEWFWSEADEQPAYEGAHRYEHGMHFYRLGKKNAGRLLDGRTWDELPKGSQ